MMEVGDIVLYRTTSLIGKLIRKITGHPHSHVAIAVSEDSVIEATAFTRSKIVPLMETKFDHVHIMRLKGGLTDDQKTQIVKHIDDVLDKRYDYKGVFLLALNILTGLDKSKARKDLSKVWCSEMVDYLYTVANVKLVDDVINHHVDIKDIEMSDKIEQICYIKVELLS